MIKCFFAYSDKGNSVSESINSMVKDINDGGYIKITPWNVMKIQGASIPLTIKENIDSCDVFICDISNLNNNVLFELGYAIGKYKPVWIFINSCLKGVREDIKKLDILGSVGYQEYSNSQQLTQLIWNLSEKIGTPLMENLEPHRDSSHINEFFYLKSIKESEQSLWVSNAVKKLSVSYHTDDPEETVRQPIRWYIKELVYSNGVIAYLQGNLDGSPLRNCLISFVAGIAFGLSMPVLLLAGNSFEAPMDYKDNIVWFRDKEHCERAIKNWYEDNRAKLSQDSSSKLTQRDIRQRNKLQNLRIGQNVAENESEELIKYFVETSAYRDAQCRNLSLFIGRKGVGKTANLYKLADALQSIKSHVCVIKPVQYEIDGIIELMNQLSSAEKSYLVQSIWKYLIYTELLKNIYENIERRPLYYEKNSSEQEIYKFVKDNEGIILNEFSDRTQKIIGELISTKVKNENQEEYRIKVSEILHERVISKIRKNLSDYCGEKDKIVILIDNLDKSWNTESDTEQVSKFILGLLDVGEAIVKDFSKDSNWNKKINITLVVFLREDIFSIIKRYAPEADKLQISKMVWDDEELLLRVIEKRLSLDGEIDVWSEFFCNEVSGMNVKEFLIKSVLPKPRDLISLVSMAIDNAVNRNHSIIEEKDIQDAAEKYSEFAYQTLITELQVEYPEAEDFLLEIIGGSNIIEEEQLKKYAGNVNIKDNRVEELITLLCFNLFLGIETRQGEYNYCYDVENYKKYKKLSKRLSTSSGTIKYRIHPAFYSALMVEACD